MLLLLLTRLDGCGVCVGKFGLNIKRTVTRDEWYLLILEIIYLNVFRNAIYVLCLTSKSSNAFYMVGIAFSFV